MTTITPTTRKYEWQAMIREAQENFARLLKEAEERQAAHARKQAELHKATLRNHLQLVLWKLGIEVDPDDIQDGEITMPGGIRFEMTDPLKDLGYDRLGVEGHMFVSKLDMDSGRSLVRQQFDVQKGGGGPTHWLGLDEDWLPIIGDYLANRIDTIEKAALEILQREAELAAEEAYAAAMAESAPAPEPEDIPEPEPPPSPIIIVWADLHGLIGIREAEEEVAHHIENGYSLVHTHIDGDVIREEDTNSRSAYFILTSYIGY